MCESGNWRSGFSWCMAQKTDQMLQMWFPRLDGAQCHLDLEAQAAHSGRNQRVGGCVECCCLFISQKLCFETDQPSSAGWLAMRFQTRLRNQITHVKRHLSHATTSSWLVDPINDVFLIFCDCPCVLFERSDRTLERSDRTLQRSVARPDRRPSSSPSGVPRRRCEAGNARLASRET